MANCSIGQVPARYSFLLNPYRDVRLSKCPQCERPTHSRKFPLFIHVDKWGALVLGKTCRYCTPCELIMAHQDELERKLATSMEQLAPDAAGGKYFVLGTMDRKVWQEGLRAWPPLGDALQHVAEIKKHLDLTVKGGWGPA